MTGITLYSTRTRTKERFEPIDPSNVRMYVCGPTVYDRAHIGNARPVVVFDTLFRLLRHEYGVDHVTYVRNITDVEDKINARAAESGRPIRDITEETGRWYHEDMDALGALPPTMEPRATEYIAPMVAMIATLTERGNAYAADGHVLFAVASYPDYGKFAHRSLDEMQAGARVEVAPYKRDPMDFVLWKPSGPDEPGWDSPWGRGRPGWHIECSAMSYELLGPSFDIHGGGIDLVFPHHENEIAQSRCAHPEGGFANVWMHNGFLNVEGEKMSKSLGNFFTVRDLLDRGIPGEVIRFVLLSTHYRAPIDWTARKVNEAEAVVDRWRRAIDVARASYLPAEADGSVQSQAVLASLRNDLDTWNALRGIDVVAKRLLEGAVSVASFRDAGLKFLNGLDLLGFTDIDSAHDVEIQSKVAIALQLRDRIDTLVRLRQHARREKNFAKSDAIRGLLNVAGVVIEDGTQPDWRLESKRAGLGWLAVAGPAKDGKTRVTLAELRALADESGVEIEEDEEGGWAEATVSGTRSGVDLRFIELAEREAKA